MFARILAACCCLSALTFAGSLDTGSQKVVVFLNEGAAPDVIRAMQKEVEVQMATTGYRTMWNVSEVVEYGTAVVAKLHGTCSASAIEHGSSSVAGQELAGTKVIEDRISPFITLDCTRVNEFLGAKPGTVTDQAYGRALGRLMAHELYHFLAQTKDHSKSGIAQAAITPSELLSEHVRFDAQAMDRLRPAVDRGF